MDLFRSVRFAFRSPSWVKNLFALSVCLVIPVVGQIVAYGYLYGVVESLHRRGRDDSYPDFDLHAVVAYLTRGVWPWLANFLIGLLMGVPYMVVYLGVFAMRFAVESKMFSEELAIVLTAASVALLLLLVLGITVVSVPVMLRCGLQQELGPGFSPGYLFDFLSKVGLQCVGVLLYTMVMSFVMGFLGLLLCCVGILPALAVVMFTYHHLVYQLYEQYLQRGGMAIPLKPLAS